jgi:hypothetical protein
MSYSCMHCGNGSDEAEWKIYVLRSASEAKMWATARHATIRIDADELDN